MNKKFLSAFLNINFVFFSAFLVSGCLENSVIKDSSYYRNSEIFISDDINLIHENCLIKCPAKQDNDNLLIDHNIILLSANRKTKFADWVAYKVLSNNLDSSIKRPRNWRKDPKIDEEWTLTPKDYKGLSNAPYFYDRGHQAPLAAFKNHPEWYVVNYLSNITPQKKFLNQGAWNKLESIERKLSFQFKAIYVLTGPYYNDNQLMQAPLNKRIKYIIPAGYWKIISYIEHNQIKSFSFIFPQQTPKNANYCNYIKSVYDIEKTSGLKIYHYNTLKHNNNDLINIGCLESKI